MCLCIRILFRVLREFGMEVNEAKSQLLLDIRGSEGKAWVTAHTRRTTKGEFLVIPGDHSEGPLWLPRTRRIKYLGIVLSFRRFEDQTLQWRLQCAETQRMRLIRVLHGQHCLQQVHRLSLWRACVFSSITYSLHVIGVSRAGASLLQARIAKHLRAILGQPVHLSRTTNAEVYEQAGILHPISYLLQRCLVYQTQHAQSQDPMMTSTVHVEWLDGVNASLTSLQPTSHSHSADVCHKGIETRPQEGAAPGDLLVTSRGDLPARFMCPECLLCFATLSDLKGHWRRHHDTQFPKRTDVSRGAYGLNGLPTCRFCKQDLSSWAYLEKHISEQRCVAP